MKLNKWTVGLAALGVVSLASAVKAEEGGNSVLTALSSTTISGYVDTSIHWNPGTGNDFNPPYKFGAGKADGFNLNVVQLSIAKPLDENEWAAGYNVDLWAGPDANILGTASALSHDSGSDFAIRQAYVALRMPIGNGIDWKVGVFDSIIGYESVASPNNPNYTRSYGHSLAPQTHTGVLASYRFTDNVVVSGGIANTVGPVINDRAFFDNDGDGSPDKAESYKTYMASLAFSAPDDWGALAGSTFYFGWVNGYSASYADSQSSYYAGATFATPVTGLRFGACIDYLRLHDNPSAFVGGSVGKEAWAAALYASYQATEKLSLHFRGEYLRDKAGFFGFLDQDGTFASPAEVYALTATAQYDLWKNVISRLEVRWDHGNNGQYFGAAHAAEGGISKDGYFFEADHVGSKRNEWLAALNIIYKF